MILNLTILLCLAPATFASKTNATNLTDTEIIASNQSATPLFLETLLAYVCLPSENLTLDTLVPDSESSTSFRDLGFLPINVNFTASENSTELLFCIPPPKCKSCYRALNNSNQTYSTDMLFVMTPAYYCIPNWSDANSSPFVSQKNDWQDYGIISTGSGCWSLVFVGSCVFKDPENVIDLSVLTVKMFLDFDFIFKNIFEICFRLFLNLFVDSCKAVLLAIVIVLGTITTLMLIFCLCLVSVSDEFAMSGDISCSKKPRKQPSKKKRTELHT